MTYCAVRFYSGSETANVPTITGWIEKELIPQFARIPGFRRYSGLQLKDGRLGSFSVFDDKHAAEQAAPISRAWMQSRPELAQFTLDMAMQGQVGIAIAGNTPAAGQKAYAVARIYRTDASFEDINAAVEAEGLSAIRDIPGLLRYTTAKLEDGRFATFNAFQTEEGTRAVTQTAKQYRAKTGSLLSKVLPNDPEVLEGTILFTHTR